MFSFCHPAPEFLDWLGYRKSIRREEDKNEGKNTMQVSRDDPDGGSDGIVGCPQWGMGKEPKDRRCTGLWVPATCPV